MDLDLSLLFGAFILGTAVGTLIGSACCVDRHSAVDKILRIKGRRRFINNDQHIIAFDGKLTEEELRHFEACWNQSADDSRRFQ